MVAEGPLEESERSSQSGVRPKYNGKVENFPPFDGFAVPPLLAKGLGYGLKLERRR